MIVVVADASPLIALQQIEQLGLLEVRADPDLVDRILQRAGEKAEP